MVKHIVLWKLSDVAEGKTKWENAKRMKAELEALVGVIPELIDAQVGLNENGGEYDAALITTFNSIDDLKAYDIHPEHQKIRDFITKVRISRVAVDYEF